MRTDNRRIQLEFLLIECGQRSGDTVPDTCFAPAIEALIDRVPVAKTFGQIAPGDAGVLDEEDGIDEEAVVFGGDTAVGGFARQEFFDALILRIAQRVSWCCHGFSSKYRKSIVNTP